MGKNFSSKEYKFKKVFIIIYITHSSEKNAKQLTNCLLEERLIACTNIFPIQSAYWWQGKIQNDDEVVSLVKTTSELWERVKSRVEELHPYDVPAIIKMEVEGNDAYEKWIKESVKE